MFAIGPSCGLYGVCISNTSVKLSTKHNNHTQWCQGHNLVSCLSTYVRYPPAALRTCSNGAHARGLRSPPQSAMSTPKELVSDGWVAVAYVLPMLLLRKSLIKSTSTRIYLGVAVSWARRQKTRERMHRITCCMKLSRLMNRHICHSLMLATTDSLINPHVELFDGHVPSDM